jgi:hypothetical protein
MNFTFFELKKNRQFFHFVYKYRTTGYMKIDNHPMQV